MCEPSVYIFIIKKKRFECTDMNFYTFPPSITVFVSFNFSSALFNTISSTVLRATRRMIFTGLRHKTQITNGQPSHEHLKSKGPKLHSIKYWKTNKQSNHWKEEPKDIHFNGHTITFLSTDLKVTTTLCSAINSTTRKYYSIAFIWMVTL